MKGDIDQMIAKDVQPTKMVIQGKGEIAYVSRPGSITEIRDIPDLIVFYDIGYIIKVIGRSKCVGIDDKSCYGYKEYRNDKTVSSGRKSHLYLALFFNFTPKEKGPTQICSATVNWGIPSLWSLLGWPFLPVNLIYPYH